MSDPYGTRDDLAVLADRCDTAADRLIYEAENAAEILPGRAGGDLADPQEWAARKVAAAAAAREYAAGLRAEAASAGAGGRPTAERMQQAEMVARGAEMGGILVDGRQLDEAAMKNPFNSPAMRHAIAEAGRERREAIDGSGLFEHVAEDGQVPYWRLGNIATPTDAPADTSQSAVVDEDCAEA